jgi:CRP-like cAMP-binding protein
LTVALDEYAAMPPDAPMEVVPLAAVLGGRKSEQFPAVPAEALDEGVDAGAAAYEISLDEADLEMEVADLEAVPEAPPPSPPSSAPSPSPSPSPSIERLDSDLDFGALVADSAPPAPPRPRAPLPRIPLFSSLTEHELLHVIDRVTVREVAAGETVLKQGERGGALFVIVRGSVQVVLEGPPRRELATISDGDFFGELALITDFPRSATVVASQPTEVLELGRPLFSELVSRSPEVLRTLLRFFRDRLINRLLGTSPLFAAFNPDEARSIAARFVFLELEPKMRVVVEGERSPGLFLLLAGEVHVTQGHKRLAALGPGDVFGEMSLLTRAPAMASIDTVGKCWALELPRADFQEIMLTYPQLLEYVSALAERRTQENLAAADDRVEFL